MAFVPTINAIKLVVIGTWQGQEVVVEVTVRTPTPPSIADLEDAAEAMEAFWTSEMAPILSNGHTAHTIKAYDMSSSTAPVFDLPVSITGGVGVASVPNNVALVNSFRTANRGRSGRGRIYLPALPNNVGNSVSTSAGTATAIAAAWADFVDYFGPLNFIHCVVSFFQDGVARTQGLKQDVTSYIINVDYDSQRRRLLGRGS